MADRDGEQVRLQQRNGYRMQENLHVSVPNEEKAMEAIAEAFKNGVTDIITFDYWSPKLNEQKMLSRKKALKAAKDKADVLLDIFEKRPPVINVREQTHVYFPQSLYHTFQNVLEEQRRDYRQSRPTIKAYRPKMTFLRGVNGQIDDRPSNVMMRPEIVVVSTVRLYFQPNAEASRTRKE